MTSPEPLRFKRGGDYRSVSGAAEDPYGLNSSAPTCTVQGMARYQATMSQGVLLKLSQRMSDAVITEMHAVRTEKVQDLVELRRELFRISDELKRYAEGMDAQ